MVRIPNWKGQTVIESMAADFSKRDRTYKAREMKWIVRKEECCGCQACQDVCPAGAVHMHLDSEGFWYPVKEEERCTHCMACERVCPMDLPIMLQTGRMLMECNELFGQYECGLSDDETPALGTYNLNDADSFG